MKRWILSAGILLLVSANTHAQTRTGKAKAKQNAQSKNAPANKSTAAPGPIMLNTTISYPAKTNTRTLSSLTQNYVVSDPILTTLDARANGANIRFNNSGVIGMPKRAYGFANGHISLSSTGAVTSGTQTGSGAVGTGTSMATFGSIGAPMNVNGKSPYGGMNMWGNAMNLSTTRRDSFVRIPSIKKH